MRASSIFLSSLGLGKRSAGTSGSATSNVSPGVASVPSAPTAASVPSSLTSASPSVPSSLIFASPSVTSSGPASGAGVASAYNLLLVKTTKRVASKHTSPYLCIPALLLIHDRSRYSPF